MVVPRDWSTTPATNIPRMAPVTRPLRSIHRDPFLSRSRDTQQPLTARISGIASGRLRSVRYGERCQVAAAATV